FVDFFEALVLFVCAAESKDFRRFGTEEIARGVDAINANVVERAAAFFLIGPNIFRTHLPDKGRHEKARIPEFSRTYELYGRHIRIFEMQPISNHQLNA